MCVHIHISNRTPPPHTLHAGDKYFIYLIYVENLFILKATTIMEFRNRK